ncbi:hypothetical protein Clacol_010240 [Clathrus columnatus]|uniref:AMP-dependent synthetase/ligase domain-containing protein n=1 Tax=Clathrus columnatus TaxID=1419009 RepID=A0AAV5AMT5_9AGAM|nr:hypothetical protein Clacol_010240 [Clathrus columnatus]
MNHYQEQPEILWEPPYGGHFSRVEHFRRRVIDEFILTDIDTSIFLLKEDYNDLHKYSTEDWEFWQDVWEFTGVTSSIPPEKVVLEKEDGSLEFFPGTRLNYAENILRRNDDAIAITAIRETGSVVHYTRRQVRSMVCNVSNALRFYGVRPLDRVAAITTNSVNAVVLALACATVGALYSTTAPDMGVPGILDRYRQITPKLLFSDTEILYAGKRIDLCQKLEQYHNKYIPETSNHSEDLDLVFEQLPFNHPLWILFSSGTTGPPKCIVHSAGGTLIQMVKEWAVVFDTSGDDCLLQYTTLLNLWDRVTILGIGPRFLGELQGSGIKPLEIASFPSLRTVFSTGAVLTPPMYRWVYEVFPKYIYLSVSSDGTDVCTAFVTGIPSLPVYAGEMQGKSLGMKVEVFDPEGKNIEDTFTPGELVCTRPHPSLPLYFWNDKDGKKYHSAYYEKYPGVWTQGDFLVVNPVTKGARILGRSDGVLNPSGVRFGSGEIYAVLERFSEKIDDSLCIGQRRPQDSDERVLLFMKLRTRYKLSPQFEQEIRQAIRTSLSRRHEPTHIFEVTEIPYTINNKKIEIAVKQVISGTTLKPSGTVANPGSLEQYKKYFELEKLIGETNPKPGPPKYDAKL